MFNVGQKVTWADWAGYVQWYDENQAPFANFVSDPEYATDTMTVEQINDSDSTTVRMSDEVVVCGGVPNHFLKAIEE